MTTYDLIIIGGGAAGLSSAIYAGRALLKTLVIEKFSYGGRVNDTPKIINYPGFKEISGRDLINEFRKQAEGFPTNEFAFGTVKEIEKTEDGFVLRTLRRREYTAKAVIIATGTYAKMLNVPGETEFAGRGVSYCSTCDADYFKDKDIHILGSGDLALEEADYLSNFANSINMIIIHEEGKFDGNKLEVKKIMKNPKISYTWNSKLEGINELGKLGYFKEDVLNLIEEEVKVDRELEIAAKIFSLTALYIILLFIFLRAQAVLFIFVLLGVNTFIYKKFNEITLGKLESLVRLKSILFVSESLTKNKNKVFT
ncbi:NAD(P)/FAD-dependent oxidoreductase [Peptoniphilus genitalis]